MVVEEGQSMSCFNCNSYLQQDCSLEIVPEKYKIECPDSSYNICRKIKQVIDFEVNGLQPNIRTIRMCGKLQEEPNKCYQRSGFGGRQIVCACDQENCNASSTIYMSTALLIGALLLGKLSM
ncbi:hypothetical protein Trydic_g3165 [Trypoxylus dichotomus]